MIRMHGYFFMLLFPCLQSVPISAQDFESNNNVLMLTDADFDMALEDHEFLLVLFCSPYVADCQSLTSEYEKAAKILASEKSNVKLAKVDAIRESKIAQRYKVWDYPTIQFFINQSPSDYTGKRDAKGIAKWINKKSGPKWTIVDAGALMNFRNREEALIVAFMNDLESEEAGVFKEVAITHDEMNFYFVNDETAMEQLNHEDGAIVLMTNYGEEKDALFMDELTVENLLKFVNSLSIVN